MMQQLGTCSTRVRSGRVTVTQYVQGAVFYGANYACIVFNSSPKQLA
jgi:hypothetical protein